jgi:hypothetical protein
VGSRKLILDRELEGLVTRPEFADTSFYSHGRKTPVWTMREVNTPHGNLSDHIWLRGVASPAGAAPTGEGAKR